MLETRNFLLPDATFIIEMVAFVVVLVVMTRYVVPRIRRSMQARQNAISAALAGAQEAERRQHEAQQESLRIRAEARREAREITDQARSMRDHLIAEGRAGGIAEYRWLAGRAERELHRRSELGVRQLRQQARAAAIAAARTYLGTDVDVARIARMVDDQLDRGEGTDRTVESPQAA